ncbi:hypothetical protein VKT23_007382 [Stygiomarasmius scandens]|uniref:Uncharacterized protein n=1 Tax=Marasmiellus scandens TaxID=2682957 RepID=A0ABR1JKN4_9AGAR
MKNKNCPSPPSYSRLKSKVSGFSRITYPETSQFASGLSRSTIYSLKRSGQYIVKDRRCNHFPVLDLTINRYPYASESLPGHIHGAQPACFQGPPTRFSFPKPSSSDTPAYALISSTGPRRG